MEENNGYMGANANDLDNWRIAAIPHVIYYIPNFVTESEEKILLDKIYDAPKPKWVQLSKRRLQNWGGLPLPRGMLAEPIPSWLQSVMTKIDDHNAFDGKKSNHVLINEYLPGQGIMPHVDGPLFYPTISTVTLGSHTVLDFYCPKKENQHEDNCDQISLGSVLLERRSLIVVKDEMYTDYLHGIREQSQDLVTRDLLNVEAIHARVGDTVPRQTRVSLTIRHCPKVLKNNFFGRRPQ